MQLIWFRQDLRVHDHTALWHATQAGSTIAIVYLSPEQWKLHDDAPIKIDLYLRQLQQLKNSLAQYNIPLLVKCIPLWKDISVHLLELCPQLNIQTVHTNQEAGFNEIQRDLAVEQSLKDKNIAFELYDDRTLFPLGSIRNKSQLPYQVFGAFKKNCYEQLRISLPTCYDVPQAQPEISLDEALFEPIPQIETFYPEFQKNDHQLAIGEAHALDVLNQFIEDQVEFYKVERDFPALKGTSQLSTYLNIGILSIRQYIQALFNAQQGYLKFDSEGQQTCLDELLWREFYQHILYDFQRVSKHLPFKKNTQKIQWRDAPEDLKAWQYGLTGVPIVDAGMRQMLATGWMHNRVRMIVAMFLSKNLLIDWRLGEQWFMQHLVDGDLAANNGGWQWCSSTGTDSVPYFRVFNPISQSQKFDANGDYIRRWVPELAHLDAKSIHDPYAKNLNLKLNYPRPIVDLKQSRIRAIEAFKGI